MIASNGDLNWEAIANQLIQENEQLRFRIVGLKNADWFEFNFDQTKDFIQENYLVIIAVLYALSVVIDLIGKWRSGRER